MNPVMSSLVTSSATEPKRSAWLILGRRFHKSGAKDQRKWMDANLKRAGFNPAEWMKTGEMPSEMICRFAQKSRKSIDRFLLDVMKM